jgi:hypothetical protein
LDADKTKSSDKLTSDAIEFASGVTCNLPCSCKPNRRIVIRNNLPYILLVKSRDINRVALIAGFVIIVIIVTTQWENIASPVQPPDPLKPVQAQTNQPAHINPVHTTTPPPHGRLEGARDARPHDERIANGERLSLQFCGTCHVYPKPEVLTRVNWSETLLRMSKWLGMQPPGEELINSAGFDRIMAAGVFPAKPMMSNSDFKDIIEYYIRTAPKKLPIANRPNVSLDLDLFEPFKPEREFDAAVMTVRVNHQEGGLWVMHEATLGVYELDAEFQWKSGSTKLESPASAIVSSKYGILATLLGRNWQGGWIPQGALVRFNGDKTQSLGGILHRPTDILPLDLNQDGREDLVITEYGGIFGRVFWMENIERGYKRHTLMDLPGGLNVASGNFNDDKIPDLVILTGQAREAVHLFLSTGPGKFEHRMILMRQPAWGHTHIEVVDFNKDSHPDLLITNGDYDHGNSPPKPYNGVRLHMNDGNNNFTEAFFFPQYGAYRALAADFDGDGDLDIASIAYLGKYDLSPDAGFVYLQQDKPLEFTARTLPASRSGRWLTMDVGDIDRDGDLDIALGAFNDGKGKEFVSPQFNEQWQVNPVPVLILKNRAKKNAAASTPGGAFNKLDSADRFLGL